MKKNLPSYLRGLFLSGIIIIMMSINTYASHIVGAELSYKWVAGTCNTYVITVNLYGDCGPASAGSFSTLPTSSPFICINDGATNVTNISLAIQAPNTGLEVTPVCPDSLAFDQCSVPSSSLPGIKKFVYSNQYIFPHLSAYWRLIYTGNNGTGAGAGRAVAITNLFNPGGTIMGLIDTLNNSMNNTRGHNSSPVLTVEPIPYFCHDSLLKSCYNPGAVDLNDIGPGEPAGDSLAFSLIIPNNGTSGTNCNVAGTFCSYVSNQYPGGPLCTGDHPLTVHDATPASYSFDPYTGQLCFIPAYAQRSVVVYNVQEYRDDTLGKMTSIAGTGVAGYGGDGGPGLSAQLNRPAGVVINSTGDIYFADCFNNRVRKIAAGGTVTTVAGTGTAGYTGDGGTAITANLNHPMGIALDAAGNLFIADMNNHAIRKVTPGGIISTIAGNGTPGFAGDLGPAAAATCQLNSPIAVFADAAGNIYISDTANERIRRINAAGVINTIAGTGIAGSSIEGVVATTANINNPYGLYVDATSTVYFADSRNNAIRAISPGGVITTVVGTLPLPSAAGFSGDGALALGSHLNNPTGVFIDNNGQMLIADHLNNRIRMVNTCKYITTLDGNGTPGFLGDGGVPLGAELDSMLFVVSDVKGNRIISDYRNNRIREVVRVANVIPIKVGTMQREMTFLVKDCSNSEPVGNIDTGFGGGIHRIDPTHYYGCANSGIFTLQMNPIELTDTTLNITITATGLSGGLLFSVTGNGTPHPHATVTGNTSIIIPGDYVFYLTYTDNHCPLVGTNTVAFSVEILPVPTIRDSLISLPTCSQKAAYWIMPGGTGKPWTIKVSGPWPDSTDTFQVFTFDTSAFVDSLAPGLYTLTIFTSVSNDCSQYVQINVLPDTFAITATSDSPTYCGAQDGKIRIHGLTPGHADTVYYRFNGVLQPAIGFVVLPDSSFTITGLLAGVYDSIIAKEGLCKTINNVPVITLYNPPFIFRTVTTKNPSKCGFCDGVDTLWGLHPGQLDTINYSYQPWGGGPITIGTLSHFIGLDSMIIVSGLCGGQYTNYIANTAGLCNATRNGPFNLTAPGIQAGFDTTVHYGCHGDTIFFHNTSVPAADLTYQWNFGDGLTSTSPNPWHVYTNTTTNTVTIKLYITNTKCVDSFILTKTFDNYIHAGFTFVPDPFVCQDSLVTFTNISTGTNPTYNWYFGDGTTSTAINPTHVYTYTGTRKIMLIANENMIPVPTYYTPCYDTMIKTISIDSNSAVTILTTDSVICQGEAITFRGIYSTLGDTMVTWSFGDGTVILNQNPLLHAYDTSSYIGHMVVTLDVKYRSCPSNSATRNIIVYPYPSIFMGPDFAICPGGNPVTIKDDRNEFNPLARWKWNTGETTPGITITKPGTYVNIVTLDGCTATDTVVVLKDCYMDIPNVFSPNGDGTNDYFYPRQILTKGLVSFKMSIYNRWGQEIFETSAVDGRGWDGNFNDKAQPEGVYIYVIDARFKDGQIEHHQGNVTLLR